MRNNGKIKIWLAIVFAAAVVLYLALAGFSGEKASTPAGEFKGPTGAPYVKGPSGPPPGGN